MMRIMGLDYGTKTVGVAVSDPLGITAQAVETVTRKDENKLRKTLARIEIIHKAYIVFVRSKVCCEDCHVLIV